MAPGHDTKVPGTTGPDTTVHVLTPGRAISLDHARGRCLQSLAGMLWLTTGDGEDVVLAPGHRHTVADGGRAVVSALSGTARFAVLDCGAPPSRLAA